MNTAQEIRVLVADHDPWKRLVVGHWLAEAGFTVAEVSNGMAALRAATADPPQVVLLSVSLPEICASEVSEILRSDPRTKRAAIAYVESLPSNPIELLATVVQALEARRSGVRTPVSPVSMPLAAEAAPSSGQRGQTRLALQT